jgi:hypothetical protein
MFKTINKFIASNFSRIAEINRKYANPSIKITKAVRISLLCLRLYLIVIVGLLIYKFITLL